MALKFDDVWSNFYSPAYLPHTSVHMPLSIQDINLQVRALWLRSLSTSLIVVGQYFVVLLLLTMTTFQNPSPGHIFTEALFSNRWTFVLCAHVGVFLSMGIGLWMSTVSPAIGPKVIFISGSTMTCTLWIAGLLNQTFLQSEVFTAAIVVLLACSQPCILHGSLALLHKVPPWLHQRLLFVLTTAPDLAMGLAAILGRRLVGDPRSITLMVSSAVVLSVVSGISMSRVRVHPRQPSSAMLETSHAVVFKHDAKGKVLIQLAHATFLLHLVMMTTKVHAAIIWSPLLVTTTVEADDVGTTQALVDGLLPFSWILGSLWTHVAQSWPFFSTTVLLSIPVALLNLFTMWLPSRLTVVCSVLFYGAVRTVLFVVSARYIERRSQFWHDTVAEVATTDRSEFQSRFIRSVSACGILSLALHVASRSWGAPENWIEVFVPQLQRLETAWTWLLSITLILFVVTAILEERYMHSVQFEIRQLYALHAAYDAETALKLLGRLHEMQDERRGALGNVVRRVLRAESHISDEDIQLLKSEALKVKASHIEGSYVEPSPLPRRRSSFSTIGEGSMPTFFHGSVVPNSPPNSNDVNV